MQTKVQQWGNSLALRIPKPFAEETGMSRNSDVEISLVNGSLVVLPIEKPRLVLEELLEQVTEENLHSEVDTGPAVGKEVW